MADQVMAYRCFKDCGCVGLVTVDLPEMEKDNAKEIERAVRDGWHVERVTVEEVRAGHFGRCEAHRSPVAMMLPLAEAAQ